MHLSRVRHAPLASPSCISYVLLMYVSRDVCWLWFERYSQRLFSFPHHSLAGAEWGLGFGLILRGIGVATQSVGCFCAIPPKFDRSSTLSQRNSASLLRISFSPHRIELFANPPLHRHERLSQQHQLLRVCGRTRLQRLSLRYRTVSRWDLLPPEEQAHDGAPRGQRQCNCVHDSFVLRKSSVCALLPRPTRPR